MTEPVDLEKQLEQAREYIRLLLPVYEAWWYKATGYDPGDGSPNILIKIEDDQMMGKACEAVDPHELAIRAFIETGE